MTTWPADAIERRPLASLIPYARNARKHTARQIAEIAASISEWGWTMPVLIDDADPPRIIAGHGRVLAAQTLQLADVPVVIARGWSEAQKRSYTLADNELALHATWNKELLRIELQDLAAQGADIAKIGFAPDAALAPEIADEDLPRALQLEPNREYCVILCATADEWERLKVALSLTPVRRGGYKKGSPLDDIGTQRVVPAAALLGLLEGT
jgi:ParB-like chromosome segregation protein Spo0J